MTNGLHIHIYIPVITCKKIYSFSGFFVDVGAFPRSWKHWELPNILGFGQKLGACQYLEVCPKFWEFGQKLWLWLIFRNLPNILELLPILAAIKLMQFWKMRESDYEKCFWKN